MLVISSPTHPSLLAIKQECPSMRSAAEKLPIKYSLSTKFSLTGNSDLVSKFLAKNLLTKSLLPVNENLVDKEYLIGNFSAADLMLGHSCFMANRLGCVGEDMTNIKAYVERIKARPAFAKAITMGE